MSWQKRSLYITLRRRVMNKMFLARSKVNATADTQKVIHPLYGHSESTFRVRPINLSVLKGF